MNNQYILPVKVILNPPDVIINDISAKVVNLSKQDYITSKSLYMQPDFASFGSILQGSKKQAKEETPFLFWSSFIYSDMFVKYTNIKKTYKEYKLSNVSVTNIMWINFFRFKLNDTVIKKNNVILLKLPNNYLFQHNKLTPTHCSFFILKPPPPVQKIVLEKLSNIYKVETQDIFYQLLDTFSGFIFKKDLKSEVSIYSDIEDVSVFYGVDITLNIVDKKISVSSFKNILSTLILPNIVYTPLIDINTFYAGDFAFKVSGSKTSKFDLNTLYSFSDKLIISTKV